MIREYSPENVIAIRGGHLIDSQRTSLHIPFPIPPAKVNVPEDVIDSTDPMQAFQELTALIDSRADSSLRVGEISEDGTEWVYGRQLDEEEIKNPFLFNAIGSLATQTAGKDPIHLPVLDVGGGVFVDPQLNGRRAVLYASRDGMQDLRSSLDFMLEDNHGISIKVYERCGVIPRGMLSPLRDLPGSLVRAVVLGSRKENTFVGFNSPTEGNGHLYIQRRFTPDQHQHLLIDMGHMGIVSKRWLETAEQAGMGIVRTPWTQKPIASRPS
jgi:hypothetical protein